MKHTKKSLDEDESTVIYAENGHAKRVRMEKNKTTKGVREVLFLSHKSGPLAKCSLSLESVCLKNIAVSLASVCLKNIAAFNH